MHRILSCTIGLLAVATIAFQHTEAAQPPDCDGIDSVASSPLHAVTLPPASGCTAKTKNRFSVPDPDCTPGAINPTLTLDVLRNKNFRTTCVRNKGSTPKEKNETYGWYHIKHPAKNTGSTQTCELDHLISLELGG